jgi:hypothetical protein
MPKSPTKYAGYFALLRLLIEFDTRGPIDRRLISYNSGNLVFRVRKPSVEKTKCKVRINALKMNCE